MDFNKIYKAITVLAILGIGLSSYLLYSYITKPAFRPCSVSASVNCDAVIDGPIALTLGLPTALYGLIGYFVILIASVNKKPKLAFGMATFGMLFCLRLTFIEIFQLKVICPVCLTCQFDMLAIFLLTIVLLKKKPAPEPQIAN